MVFLNLVLWIKKKQKPINCSPSPIPQKAEITGWHNNNNLLETEIRKRNSNSNNINNKSVKKRVVYMQNAHPGGQWTTVDGFFLQPCLFSSWSHITLLPSRGPWLPPLGVVEHNNLDKLRAGLQAPFLHHGKVNYVLARTRTPHYKNLLLNKTWNATFPVRLGKSGICIQMPYTALILCKKDMPH